MGKSASAKQQVSEYNMSIHWAICAQADYLRAIYVGQKLAWSGKVDGATPIQINNDNLFGGIKKEGGVRGIAYYLPGDKTQMFPTGLAGRRGLTSTSSPAYRGLASIYFVGTTQPGLGFYWGATPYLPEVWMTVQRSPKGLDSAYAMIASQFTATVAEYGYTVTVGGATATVSDGVPTLVGGHTVTISIRVGDGSQIIVLDGTSIVVSPYRIDSDGNQKAGGTTVAVDGNSQTLSGTSASINGVGLTIDSGRVTISVGASGGGDANPAGIIYEALTNSAWGMGADDNIIDRANFEAVAKALFNEGFGLSIVWTRESTIEDFIGEILDHIQAAIYVDPNTGKLTLKLFRNDYDETTLRIVSPDNAVLDSFQRKLWGETINEIGVTWTNPVNEQEETITQQDLGNVVAQGDVVSDSRNYYGVRTSELAQRLALRDLRQSSTPLASVEALLDRSEWDLKPGDVVGLTWPEYDIDNLVMRIMSVDYGKAGSPNLTVTMIEDIFSLEHASYLGSVNSGFVDQSQSPSPMNRSVVYTTPSYFSSRLLSAADLNALAYPEVLVSIIGASDNTDASFYEVLGESTLANGTAASEERGTRGLLAYTELTNALVEEATSTINFGPVTSGVGPNIAGFMFIGDGTELTTEIALIQSYTDGVGWTIQRGVLDTIPRAWPAGTGVRFYDERNGFIDGAFHSAGENVTFKLLTKTSLGTLDEDAAPLIGTTLTARPYLPLRPANVQFQGIGFGPIDLSASSPSSVNITWSNRNRTLEDVVVLGWNDGNVVPETGQTTTIYMRKTSDQSLIKTYSSISGTSYSVPSSDFGSEIEADFTVVSERDGYESLMGIARRVRIRSASDGSAVSSPPPSSDTPTYTPPETYPPSQRPPAYTGGGRAAIP